LLLAESPGLERRTMSEREPTIIPNVKPPTSIEMDDMTLSATCDAQSLFQTSSFCHRVAGIKRDGMAILITMRVVSCSCFRERGNLFG
jgi:hypothetical protein